MTADDVLDESDIVHLGNKIKVERIKDRLFVPAHNRPTKTIMLIKVYHSMFDLPSFVKNLLDCLIPETEVRIGLSFVMWQKDLASYVHPIHSRIINNDNRIISDYEDKTKLVTFLKGFSYVELMNYAFTLRNTANPFAESGYRPGKLVTATFWLSKYPSP